MQLPSHGRQVQLFEPSSSATIGTQLAGAETACWTWGGGGGGRRARGQRKMLTYLEGHALQEGLTF